jgi:hypothetical protein
MIRCCCKLNFIKLAFHFVWTIKQSMFVYWLYDTLNKALGFLGGGFGSKFWIYSTVFTPHIYFIILISMIAGNLVEISRKCLRKFNFNEIRLPWLSAYHLPQPKDFFPSMMLEMYSV